MSSDRASQLNTSHAGPATAQPRLEPEAARGRTAQVVGLVVLAYGAPVAAI